MLILLDRSRETVDNKRDKQSVFGVPHPGGLPTLVTDSRLHVLLGVHASHEQDRHQCISIFI